MDTNTTTALVTGATSGLGLEAAAQIAERGIEHVIVTGRTPSKAGEARKALLARTGRNVFETLALDNDDIASVEAAAEALLERGGQIDLLILNAGIAPPGKVTMSHDGIERTVSSTLIGHHILTMRLLEHDLLAPHAHIIIAGSEAARGDVPLFKPADLRVLADEYFKGDIEAAVEAQMRMEPPATYKAGDVYATAKMFVAWWVAELARRLPDGMSVAAVSPGSTPGTNAARNAPAIMRYFLLPMFKFIPGMSHGVADGAGRYLEIADRRSGVNGQFFASPPGKMTGPLTRMDLPHVNDRAAQQAGWDATISISGVGMPAAGVPAEQRLSA